MMKKKNKYITKVITKKRIININIPQLKAPNIKMDSIKIKEVNVGYDTNKDSVHYESIWSQETSQGIKQLNIIKNHFQQQKAFAVTWNTSSNLFGVSYVWGNAYSGDLDWGKGQSMDEFFSEGHVNQKHYFYQKNFWFNITYEVEELIDNENIKTKIKDYENFINEINNEIKNLKNIIKS